MSTGTMEWETEGTWTWAIQAGWAAQSGIMAARIAREGFLGPHTILEGKNGFYHNYALEGNYNLNILNKGLGKTWQTLDLAYKPYPACQMCQAYIDCALAIKKEDNVDFAKIEALECRVGRTNGLRLCEPPEVKKCPTNIDSAQTSIPYTIAAALVEGKVGVPEVSEGKIGDTRILNLAKKLKVTVDTSFDTGPAIRGWVKVTMKDGTEYIKETLSCKGSPGNPWSEAEVTDKFMNNATLILTKGKATKIVQLIKGLEKVSDLSELMVLCKK
jgi:2-methylcitrate dehydratase PrpD